jgi:hypothetical protein
MSNGDKGKSSFEESMKVLEKFCNDVRGDLNIEGLGVTDKLSKKANNALSNWNNISKSIEFLKEYINPKILYDDEYKRNLEQKRSDIDLDLHDSLKMLFYLYDGVCKSKTSPFSSEELEKVGKALEHQANVLKHCMNFASGIHVKCVCDIRPRTCKVCGKEV